MHTLFHQCRTSTTRRGVGLTQEIRGEIHILYILFFDIHCEAQPHLKSSKRIFQEK